jgi:hypothetical protein
VRSVSRLPGILAATFAFWHLQCPIKDAPASLAREEGMTVVRATICAAPSLCPTLRSHAVCLRPLEPADEDSFFSGMDRCAYCDRDVFAARGEVVETGEWELTLDDGTASLRATVELRVAATMLVLLASLSVSGPGQLALYAVTSAGVVKPGSQGLRPLLGREFLFTLSPCPQDQCGRENGIHGTVGSSSRAGARITAVSLPNHAALLTRATSALRLQLQPAINSM